jgi:Ketopantoate reductase PanE/ApbA
MSQTLEILVVGAGAVGRVLGHHFARGGANVTYLVRGAHAAELARGFTLYPMHRGGAPVAVAAPAVITSADDARARRFDAVVLCMSSPALRRGDWLAPLAAAAPDATFVGVQPGFDDPAHVARATGAGRVAWGMFPLMSWSTADVDAPTAEPRPAGTAYWKPPLTALPFSGDRARVEPLTRALSRGGLRARRAPDVPRALALAGPLLEMHVVALECAGFELAALTRDRALLTEAHGAIDQARTVAARRLGIRPPRAHRLLKPWLAAWLLRLVRRLTPFDLERYLRAHYTKVADQTAEGLREIIAQARALDVPHDAVARLADRLASTRAAAAAADAAAAAAAAAAPTPTEGGADAHARATPAS